MNTALTVASLVTAIGYIVCALVAMPARRWTIPVAWAAIFLAAATSVLDFLIHNRTPGIIFTVLVVSSTLALLAKRLTLRTRESLRRWDA